MDKDGKAMTYEEIQEQLHLLRESYIARAELHMLELSEYIAHIKATGSLYLAQTTYPIRGDKYIPSVPGLKIF